MKSKDIQKVVKIKYENGEDPTKIYRDLAGAVSLPTIKLWIKMINLTGSITLSSPPGCPRTVRTKAAIMKVKSRLNKKKRVQGGKGGSRDCGIVWIAWIATVSRIREYHENRKDQKVK
ncbi:unnamed protein product [Rotaria socialis]|uniref:Transposase n=1 Tax=Rotaria socialis TaxID=392032 RepID=A0A818LXX8_9BILA|nr:unnamed protein product [Rotaria socialis]CAF4813771.1 unnamed protein product [Rotaria socialis]